MTTTTSGVRSSWRSRNRTIGDVTVADVAVADVANFTNVANDNGNNDVANVSTTLITERLPRLSSAHHSSGITQPSPSPLYSDMVRSQKTADPVNMRFLNLLELPDSLFGINVYMYPDALDQNEPGHLRSRSTGSMAASKWWHKFGSLLFAH